MLADLRDPVERGAHAVQFYDSPDDLVPSVARFVGGGLAAGESAIVLARPEHGVAIDEALAGAGVDVDGCAGRYYTVDATSLLPDFDLRTFAATVSPLVRPLAAAGPLRVYGEMVSLLHEAGQTADALAVEAWWNAMMARVPFTLYCAYGGPEHEDLAGTHDAWVAPPRPAARRAGRVTRTFEPTLLAVPTARRFVADAMHEWGLPEDPATLLATELATNAVEHTGMRFQVSLTRLGDTVRLAVTDQAPIPLPTARELSDTATGGRGLLLVESLSREWGCDGDASGKTVWALLG